jgi:hypothetical protein
MSVSKSLNVNHDAPGDEEGGEFRLEREDPEGPDRRTDEVVTDMMLRGGEIYASVTRPILG